VSPLTLLLSLALPMPIALMELFAPAHSSPDQATVLAQPITILALRKVSNSPNASQITIVNLCLRLLTPVP